MSFCCSTPFLLALVFSTAFCSSRWLALLWLAAGVHELGHLLALHLMGVRVKRICFRLSGMELLRRKVNLYSSILQDSDV